MFYTKRIIFVSNIIFKVNTFVANIIFEVNIFVANKTDNMNYTNKF